MVEVGELSVKASIQTDDIERGIRTINVAFEDLKIKTQTSTSSMNTLAGSAAKLGTSLAVIGGTALTGLTALAGLSAVLAPEFAKFGVETFKLAQIVGQELKPAFGEALDAYSNFVSFLGGGSPLAELVKDVGILAGATGIGLVASKLLGLSKGITIPIILGFTLGELLEKPISEFFGDIFGKAGAEEQEAQQIGGAYGTFARDVSIGTGIGAAGGLALGGPPGALIGAIAGAIAGGGYGIYEISRDNFFNNTDTSGRAD